MLTVTIDRRECGEGVKEECEGLEYASYARKLFKLVHSHGIQWLFWSKILQRGTVLIEELVKRRGVQ
jgi:Fe-S cluster biosynthesis and repair protein YggX